MWPWNKLRSSPNKPRSTYLGYSFLWHCMLIKNTLSTHLEHQSSELPTTHILCPCILSIYIIWKRKPNSCDGCRISKKTHIHNSFTTCVLIHATMNGPLMALFLMQCLKCGLVIHQRLVLLVVTLAVLQTPVMRVL